MHVTKLRASENLKNIVVLGKAALKSDNLSRTNPKKDKEILKRVVYEKIMVWDKIDPQSKPHARKRLISSMWVFSQSFSWVISYDITIRPWSVAMPVLEKHLYDTYKPYQINSTLPAWHIWWLALINQHGRWRICHCKETALQMRCNRRIKRWVKSIRWWRKYSNRGAK